MESAIAFCSGCAVTLLLALNFMGNGEEQLALSQQKLETCEVTKQELQMFINGMMSNKQ